MGKKNKGDSKSKKGKHTDFKVPKTYNIDPELLKELTKDLKDVFRLWNGDVYAGQFSLTVEGGMFREGRGKYFTADGCVLSGRWESDVLVEAERISYQDGCWYQGPLEGGTYGGQGTYSLPDLGTLECSFVQGRPFGFVTLTDNDNNKWQGQATECSLTLVPRNHFFDSEDAILKKTMGKSESHSSQPKSHESSQNIT